MFSNSKTDKSTQSDIIGNAFNYENDAPFEISELSSSSYRVFEGLKTGDKYYTDRDYIITSYLPPILNKHKYMLTSNDNYSSPMSFTTNIPVNIFLAWDMRQVVPTNWTNTNEKINVSDKDASLPGNGYLILIKKEFFPGTVKLPARTIKSNYIIFILPKNSTIPNPTGNVIYVRPSKTGIYGTGDGKSYINAFNGLEVIPSTINSGTTVFICGEHFTNSIKSINPLAKGTASNPVIFRMDCTDSSGKNDNGIVWGYRGVGGSWASIGNGVYSKTGLEQFTSYIHYIDRNNHVLLERATGKSLSGLTGAWYYNSGLIYIKLKDSSSPNGQKILQRGGYDFNLAPGSQYVKFYKSTFYGAQFDFWSHSNIEFDECVLRYGAVDSDGQEMMASNLIRIRKSWDLVQDPIVNGISQGNNIFVRNSELGFAGNGLYTLTYGGGSNYYVVLENNYIHDMATNSFPYKDGHGIGIQNCVNCVFTKNRLYNTGAAIEMWSENLPMRNITVSYNYIRDTWIKNITGGGGIVVSGNTKPGYRTGFKIYGNIIENTGLGNYNLLEDWQGPGIRVNSPDYVEIYNNVIKNTRGVGISLAAPAGSAPKGAIYNNIIISPKGLFIEAEGDTTKTWDLKIDNNLYYPNADTAIKFRSNSISEAPKGTVGINQWKIAGYDKNAIIADPKFIATNPGSAEYFKLQSSSPAIDKGKMVSLMKKDFLGISIPQGAGPDIGAYETR